MYMNARAAEARVLSPRSIVEQRLVNGFDLRSDGGAQGGLVETQSHGHGINGGLLDLVVHVARGKARREAAERGP